MSTKRGSRVRFRWWLVIGLATALAGCAVSSPSTTPTTAPVAPSAPTATPTAAATNAASSAPSPAATGAADEAWDLVWFSDSSVGAVPELWAARIRERLGIEVRVHKWPDDWPDGPGSIPMDILDAIKNRADVRDAIAGAELIGVETVPVGSKAGQALLEHCRLLDSPPLTPPPSFAVADFTEYADQLRSVFDRIFELRAGQPTIIRAMDIYTPVLDQWTEAGIEKACTAGWEAHSGAMKMVAKEYGVTPASIYDLFNGADHHEDPVDKGWIGEDGDHPTAAGTAAQLDLLDSLGYEPVQR